MASLQQLRAAPPSPQPILKFHRSNFTPNAINTNTIIFFNPAPIPPRTHFSFRFKHAGRLQERQRLIPVSASKTNPPEGSDVAKSSSSAQGPPFLTILAGLFVFFVICWIIGSIVMWLVGLIINPPTK